MRAKVLIIASLLAFSMTMNAQIGIQGHFDQISASGSETQYLTTYTTGVDYWFRLDKNRLEFHPFLGYQSITDRDFPRSFDALTFEFQAHLYPMDWYNDCKCPTFGKTNDFLKKGFFFTLAPFASFRMAETVEDFIPTDNTFSWGVKGGVGLDIGFSDYITLTPTARLVYMPDHFTRSTDWDRTSFLGYDLGLRLGIRWDTQNF